MGMVNLCHFAEKHSQNFIYTIQWENEKKCFWTQVQALSDAKHIA